MVTSEMPTRSRGQMTIDRAQKDRTYRKVARRFIPFLMVCYVFAYLDRINIGVAKLTMLNDLKFNEAAFGFGAGLFFIGYLIFEVPSNLIMYRVGARIWMVRIMITWGLLSGLMAFVSRPWEFYTLRFLLGVAEAGFYPGVILYLSYWFPNDRRAKMIACFQAAIPLSGIFGPPLSGWIMKAFDQKAEIAGWQWTFVLEALPMLPLTICAFFLLDNKVDDARWLSPEERHVITSDLALDSRKHESMPLLRVLSDPRIWKLILAGIPTMMGLYTLGFYMPTLIRSAGEGLDVTTVGLLTAIPYVFAAACMIIVGQSSDRLGERRWHLAGALLVGAFGLASSNLVAHSVILTTLTLSIAAAGIISTSPVAWPLPMAFLGGGDRCGRDRYHEFGRKLGGIH